MVFLLNMVKKILSFIFLVVFLVNSTGSGYAQALSLGAGAGVLPEPGAMVSVSAAFVPPLLKGLKIDVKDPFKFNFILDPGDATMAARGLKTESAKLVRYFLASLAVPENDLWVNLSPYEKERIIPDAFGVTEMGRDLLAQDYLLKQITASLIYPDHETGKAFWAKIYQRAQEKFGTTDIPMDTFNKVWVVPAKAVVYEEGNKAVIVEAGLKVMLDSDYTAASVILRPQAEGSQRSLGRANEVSQNNTGGPSPSEIRRISERSQDDGVKQVLREVVIPVLEKEVNEGKNFSKLRQVYHALILAKWYKENLKQSLLAQAYGDRNLVKGVAIEDRDVKEKIYAQYVKAFQKGAFNVIQQEVDPVSQETVVRKYFSGGVVFQFKEEITHDRFRVSGGRKPVYDVETDLITSPDRDAAELRVVNKKEWKTWFWPNLRAGQSKIYISRDGKKALKVFNIKGMREEHVRELHEIIRNLPQDLKDHGYKGPVEVVVPELVRIEGQGLGLVTDRKHGYLFETVARRRMSVHARAELQQIAEDFFQAVNGVVGEEMADTKGIAPIGSLTNEAHYVNFLWLKDADGRERIYNIDPINMLTVMERPVGKSTGIDKAETADVLQSFDIRKELAEFASSWETAFRTSGQKQIEQMLKYSRGIGTIYDFCDFWRGLSADQRHGYGLGLWTKHFNTLSRLLGIVHFSKGYVYFGIERQRDGEHFEQYLQKITDANKVVVFFVPREAFTWGAWLESRSGFDATKIELEWLLAHPEKMKNVYFVFGAYDAISDDYLRERINQKEEFDVDGTYKAVVRENFLDPRAYAALLTPDAGPGQPGHFMPPDAAAATGGIDLTAEKMRVQTTGLGAHFQMQDGVKGQDLDHIEDLRPVINAITPVHGLDAFLSSK